MVKRRKMRKTKDKDSPSEKRMKDKDGEVAIARGRLAGALKGILNRNYEDSDGRDSSCSLNHSSNSSAKKILRESSPTQWKKQSKGNDNEDHQSYFMKLFDRSVDLAQFDMNTPLFPICRAWIQNKPILSKKKDDGIGLLEIKHDSEDNDSQLFELNEKAHGPTKSNESDVNILPPPDPLPEGVLTLRIPSPTTRDIEEINLNPDPDQAPSKEELLQSHLQNWSEVRKRWRMASFRNEQRYAASKDILTKMFDRFSGVTSKNFKLLNATWILGYVSICYGSEKMKDIAYGIHTVVWGYRGAHILNLDCEPKCSFTCQSIEVDRLVP